MPGPYSGHAYVARGNARRRVAFHGSDFLTRDIIRIMRAALVIEFV